MAELVLEKNKMKLYGIASSTCTGRVLLSLFEKEVEDFELVIVNVRKGEGKKPEYLKLQVRISQLHLPSSSLGGCGKI
jgi:hypothetical protein